MSAQPEDPQGGLAADRAAEQPSDLSGHLRPGGPRAGGQPIGQPSFPATSGQQLSRSISPNGLACRR
eukprot:3252378-Alexandrium_andersonii.AAC.1